MMTTMTFAITLCMTPIHSAIQNLAKSYFTSAYENRVKIRSYHVECDLDGKRTRVVNNIIGKTDRYQEKIAITNTGQKFLIRFDTVNKDHPVPRSYVICQGCTEDNTMYFLHSNKKSHSAYEYNDEMGKKFLLDFRFIGIHFGPIGTSYDTSKRIHEFPGFGYLHFSPQSTTNTVILLQKHKDGQRAFEFRFEKKYEYALTRVDLKSNDYIMTLKVEYDQKKDDVYFPASVHYHSKSTNGNEDEEKLTITKREFNRKVNHVFTPEAINLRPFCPVQLTKKTEDGRYTVLFRYYNNGILIESLPNIKKPKQ